MVVIIIGREFLVSGLRGYAESQGFAFPANVWGKSKTFVQSVTIGSLLLHFGHLHQLAWVKTTSSILIWTTVVVTILSGYSYIKSAAFFFKKEKGI
jgi:phosphatidylglycerophosphate synthase